ncbi:MAG: polysaccharide biosynthesis/export family protein, partial [Pseudomonadota bacterium]
MSMIDLGGARRAALKLLTFFGLALMAHGASAQDDAVERYLVQPGDVLEITVLEDPALGRQVLVRPDGRISMPLAGTIQAGGRSPEAVEATVRARLGKNFVEPPTVTVALISLAVDEEEEMDMLSLYVLGEVARPGKFELEAEEAVTILQALSLAGGLGAFAATERIQIREVIDEVETIRLF